MYVIDGWTFERQADGSVLVTLVNGIFSISATLLPGDWAAAVAAMSSRSADAGQAALARKLHDGVELREVSAEPLVVR